MGSLVDQFDDLLQNKTEWGEQPCKAVPDHLTVEIAFNNTIFYTTYAQSNIGIHNFNINSSL